MRSIESGEQLGETRAVPDSSGHYSVPNLRDGTYGVEFRADGYSQQSWPGVSTRFSYPGVFELSGGETKDNVDATLYRSGTIQGTVSAPSLSVADVLNGQIVAMLYLRDPDSGEYYFTGEQVTVPGTASYSFEACGQMTTRYESRTLAKPGSRTGSRRSSRWPRARRERSVRP